MSTLEIELTPEMDNRLREKARRKGLTAPDYARALVAEGLQQEVPEQPKHSIMELEGLGAEIWKGKDGTPADAQDYVNELRREWDHRP
jgi:hypothetical protein